ncbi:MAG TPA: hypothetical protein VHU84_17100 [Lacipirellulaceae bacterium]|nr:hypothetical protein [Lacipirellulaceae bacterium]
MKLTLSSFAFACALFAAIAARAADKPNILVIFGDDIGITNVSCYSDGLISNNVTAKRNADDAVNIQFGGCDGKTPNCLPIMPGWNYIVRLYRPRAEILDGNWKFPDAQPAK